LNIFLLPCLFFKWGWNQEVLKKMIWVELEFISWLLICAGIDFDRSWLSAVLYTTCFRWCLSFMLQRVFFSGTCCSVFFGCGAAFLRILNLSDKFPARLVRETFIIYIVLYKKDHAKP